MAGQGRGDPHLGVAGTKARCSLPPGWAGNACAQAVRRDRGVCGAFGYVQRLPDSWKSEVVFGLGDAALSC